MDEETFKGWVHASVGMAIGVMCVYNVMRWCSTKKPRNAVNVAVYLPLLIFELRQAQDHWSRTP